MRKNDTVLWVIIIGAVALIIGYQFKKKESDIKAMATDLAIKEASNYVKSESQITKDWANSLANKWKQIWK